MSKKKKSETKKGRGVAKLTAALTIPNVKEKGTVSMNNNTLAAMNHEMLTMSSREIAELTGKQHKNVMVDCRKLADFYCEIYSAEKSADLIKSATYADEMNRTYPCYALSKSACIDLVTGYSLPHRHAVNQRWQELEGRQPDPMALLNDPAALRGLLIGYTEKVEALEYKIEADAPKVAFAERHAKAEGWFCIRDAAKQIGVPERQFINHLLMDGYVYRAQGNGRLVPYAETIKRGFMDVKTHTVMREDGTEKATQQAMVLTRGIQHFQNKYQEVAA